MDWGAITGFDWDAGNWPKCGRHGVSQVEIEAVFADGPLVVPDVGHLTREKRLLAIGFDGLPRPVFVVFTLRGTPSGTLIRPISARYMHDEEVRYYVKALARPEDR